MRLSDLEIFTSIKSNGYTEIVMDDGTIVVGKDFKRFKLDTESFLIFGALSQTIPLQLRLTVTTSRE